MDDKKLGLVESKFADIIWAHEPVPSGKLVQLAKEALEWTKSTTYTVLRKLCDQGLFCNDGGTVTALVTKEQFAAMQCEQFVEETFQGSLPAFLAAFAGHKGLSAKDIAEIQQMIDDYKEG